MQYEYELIVTSDKYRPQHQQTRLFGQAIMNARARENIAKQVYGDTVRWYIRRSDGVIIAQSK